MIRFTTVAIIFGLLVAGVLYDRVEQDPNEIAVVPTTPIVTPMLEPAPPLASEWFCPIGSSAPDSYAQAEVMITNLGDEAAVANVDVRTPDGPGASLRVDLEPGATEVVDLATLGIQEAAAAVVEVVGGEGVVGHRIRSATGVAEGPCATASAPTWYFAGGSTTRDTNHYIALLNPFPNDVVFNATFQTATRSRQPGDLEAAVVPARSVLIINVADFVARERVVATTIQTVQGGQLVVERLQTFDGSLGPVGAALEMGVPTPALEWSLPAGRIHADGDNTLSIFNPTDQVAEIDVQFDPLVAADRASYGLVPLEVTVQPGRVTTIDLRLSSEQVGLPLPYELGITVVSANDVPFVVDRWQLTPAIDTDLIGAGGTSERRRQEHGEVPAEEVEGQPENVQVFAQATAKVGAATSRGSSFPSTRWVTADTSLVADNGTVVVVSAPEGALVEVRQLLGGALGSPVRSSVEAQGRAVIPIPNAVANAPLVITADRPIFVEIQIVTPDRLDVVAAVPTRIRSEGE